MAKNKNAEQLDAPVDDGQVDEPVPSRALVDKLVERGLEIDADNDDDLLESFETLLSEREGAPSKEDYERLKQLEPFATEYTRNAAEFQKWKEAQEKAGQAKEDETPAPPSPPRIDQAAAQVVQAGLGTGSVKRTSSGLYETNDASFMPFVQKVNEAQLQRREFFQRFEDDPAAFIAEYAKPHIASIDKAYKEELEAIKSEMKSLRKRSSDSSIDQFFERNYKEFWQTDEDGQVVLDKKGNQQLNVRGQLYARMMAELEEDIPDEEKRHERAIALARQVPIESAEPEPADRKKKFLKRAAGKPGRATDRMVERPSALDADKAVTEGKKRGKMDWDELMRGTAASMS